MRKVEALKVFPAGEPKQLEKAYLDWMTEQCALREKNVAVSSVAFYSDIISRTLLATGNGEYSLAIFYYDYLLEKHETGGPSHHPREGEGVSMVGQSLRGRRDG
jgi:hypothetical protein